MAFRVVTLISGSGSNLQALLEHFQNQPDVEFCAVFSNRSDAFGLERAKQFGIDTHCVKPKEFANREAYDEQLAAKIASYDPDLIVLAGFMRILSTAFIERFKGKIINIHPSLLPLYKGLNTHQRALDAGDVTHGASVHYVTAELDDGPIIVQGTIKVLNDDTAESLAERIHRVEHKLYPAAVGWIAQNRLSVVNGQVLKDNALYNPCNAHL